MKKIFLVLWLVFCIVHFANSQTKPLTTAESSDFKSTSTYKEAMNFVDDLLRSSELIRLETIATSTEGRDIPLLIIADPLPESPEGLLNDNRIKVYLQANIHAGEIEGKEATLMLMRDLLNEKPKELFEKVIILVCPILNPDGNEKFSTDNRRNQVGPENGVGVRHNGQFLDLNRDAMKLESPEIRGVVRNVFNRWDPAITVDCHTTNGSYHEEPLTFTWQINPNGDRKLINFMRDEMMPEVHNTLRDKYKVENVFYGQFLDRMNVDTSWVSYAAEPRYLVNYVGLRNRLAILNENYVYADFESRVYGCYYLLKTVLEYAGDQKNDILDLLTEVDEKMVEVHTRLAMDSFAIDYKGFPTPEPITIKAIEADTIPGMKGYWRYKQSNRKRTVTVPYIADYYATESVTIPYAYILTVPDPEILDNMKTHGIEVYQLNTPKTLEVERFKIDELKGRSRLYQGHYMNSIKGEFVTETKEFPKGTHIIYTAQKLGNVATYLLEPESDDGYVHWNFLDKYLVPQWGRGYYPYPVYKLLNETKLD